MPVTLVTADQLVDASGNLQDVYVVTFTIVGHLGTFTVTVPQTPDPVAAAQAAIQTETDQVNALYAL